MTLFGWLEQRSDKTKVKTRKYLLHKNRLSIRSDTELKLKNEHSRSTIVMNIEIVTCSV